MLKKELEFDLYKASRKGYDISSSRPVATTQATAKAEAIAELHLTGPHWPSLAAAMRW